MSAHGVKRSYVVEKALHHHLAALEKMVRPLLLTNDRNRFLSGDPDLDRFFHKYAGENPFRHHLAATYVAVARETIAGFVTVSAASMQIDQSSPTQFAAP